MRLVNGNMIRVTEDPKLIEFYKKNGYVEDESKKNQSSAKSKTTKKDKEQDIITPMLDD